MKQLRVMIVSLPGTWQRVLQKNIEAYTFTKVIGTVSGSLSASQLASQQKPDLVLIDSSIHFDDAVVLIRNLKAENPKALLISIADTTQQRRKMARSGADYTVSVGNYETEIRDILDQLGETLAKGTARSGTIVRSARRSEQEEAGYS